MIFKTWMDHEGRPYFTDTLFLDKNNKKIITILSLCMNFEIIVNVLATGQISYTFTDGLARFVLHGTDSLR